MSKQRAFIYVSDIASFIGQNKWDYTTCFERLWKKYDSGSYNNSVSLAKNNIIKIKNDILSLELETDILKTELENKKITKRQYAIKSTKLKNLVEKKEEEYTSVKNCLDDLVLTQQEKLEQVVGESLVKELQNETLETETKRDLVQTHLASLDISDKERENSQRTATSFLNKTHGVLNETSAIKMFEKKFKVRLDTCQQFFNIKVCSETWSTKEWYIGGKVDGLYIDKDNPDNSYVVEVKNRTKGFFSLLRDYEKTQIQMYMWILDVSHAKLVEKYNNKIRITVIYKDTDYIKNVLTDLRIFIKQFETVFLKDTLLQNEYITLDEHQRRMFVKKLYLDEIQNKICEIENEDECIISSSDEL
jgi:hypothetical protein